MVPSSIRHLSKRVAKSRKVGKRGTVKGGTFKWGTRTADNADGILGTMRKGEHMENQRGRFSEVEAESGREKKREKGRERGR